jgi:hypothetical protein
MPEPKTSGELRRLVSSSLKHRYGNTLAFLDRQDLASDKFDYLPKPRPQAFVSLTLANCSEPKRFFLETISQPASSAKLQATIRHYLEYEASGAWDVTGKDLPLVLMICDSPHLMSELIQQVHAVQPSDQPAIMFAVTTRAELEQADAKPNIWRLTHKPNEKLELHRLPDRPS